jgi:hypothetical protein
VGNEGRLETSGVGVTMVSKVVKGTLGV